MNCLCLEPSKKPKVRDLTDAEADNLRAGGTQVVPIIEEDPPADIPTEPPPVKTPETRKQIGWQMLKGQAFRIWNGRIKAKSSSAKNKA